MQTDDVRPNPLNWDVEDFIMNNTNKFATAVVPISVTGYVQVNAHNRGVLITASVPAAVPAVRIPSNCKDVCPFLPRWRKFEAI